MVSFLFNNSAVSLVTLDDLCYKFIDICDRGIKGFNSANHAQKVERPV